MLRLSLARNWKYDLEKSIFQPWKGCYMPKMTLHAQNDLQWSCIWSLNSPRIPDKSVCACKRIFKIYKFSLQNDWAVGSSYHIKDTGFPLVVLKEIKQDFKMKIKLAQATFGIPNLIIDFHKTLEFLLLEKKKRNK